MLSFQLSSYNKTPIFNFNGPSYCKKTYSQKQKAGEILYYILTKTDMFRKVCLYSVHQQKCFGALGPTSLPSPFQGKGRRETLGTRLVWVSHITSLSSPFCANLGKQKTSFYEHDWREVRKKRQL